MKDAIDNFYEEWSAHDLATDRLTPDILYIYRIGRISKILGERLDATCASHGLTRSQFEALAALRRAHPRALCAQELMDASLLTSGSVTTMMRQLLDAGLVSRELHPEDKRRIEVRLTRKGSKLIELAIDERLLDNTRLAQLLPKKDRAMLNKLMKRLLVTMENLSNSELL